MRSQKKPDPQKAVDEWNAKHPKGTPVRVLRDLGSLVETVTTSGAYVLSGHSAVVHVDGIAGCYALERVEAIGQAPPAPPAPAPVKLPPGPWTASGWGTDPKTGDPYAIRIMAADGSKVVDVTHHPSVGGGGLPVARAIAAWIVKHGPKE